MVDEIIPPIIGTAIRCITSEPVSVLHMKAEPPHQPQTADQGERHRQHDDHGFSHPPEIQVQQQKDDSPTSSRLVRLLPC